MVSCAPLGSHFVVYPLTSNVNRLSKKMRIPTLIPVRSNHVPAATHAGGYKFWFLGMFVNSQIIVGPSFHLIQLTVSL